MLRRHSLRYRKKSLVILAIICISSSTLYKVCLIGEKFYKKHYLVPEVKEFERRHLIPAKATLSSYHLQNNSHQAINNMLTSSRIKHQLKQDDIDCSDRECSNVLLPNDRDAYKKCSVSAARIGPVTPSNCSFLNGTQRQPIGLASFPGSGNTWVRGLLQTVTGFCTGSIYCDRFLRLNGFPGESIQSGSVLVVKTHKPRSFVSQYNNPSYRNRNPLSRNLTFDKVIFVIRDPFKAFVSEWNRRVLAKSGAKYDASHVGSIGKEYFGDNLEWVNYVTEQTKRWATMTEYWLFKWGSTHHVHVVRYEDIVKNDSREVSKMLRYIGIHVEEEDVRDKLQDGYSSFHRKVHGNFSHFTDSQVFQINVALNRTQHQMSTLKLASKFNISLTNYMKTTPI